MNQLEINYSMGKLKSPDEAAKRWLTPLSSNLFYAIAADSHMELNGWTDLENAPQGTKSQILVAFNEKLTPQEAASVLGSSLLEGENGIKADMLADVGAPIVLANSYHSALYEEKNGDASPNKAAELALIAKFNAYDN